ncbi:MAG: OmpA family protein [Bacteroidota bacterium]
MRKAHLLTTLCLCLFVGSLSAQKDTKMQADKAYEHLSYLKAADLYQQLGEGGLDAAAKARLADSYRLNGDTESAEYWYAQAVKETKDPQDMLYYAQVLQSNGKCEMALDWYDQYRVLMGENNLLPRAAVTDCNKLVFLPKQQVTVTNARQLNSGHLDYSPVPYKGGIVFTSTRGKSENRLEDTWTKDNFSDLFYAKRVGNESFTAVEELAGNINGDFHDGTATFNKSGTIMYFTRNNTDGKNAKNIVDLKIYSAELNVKKWGNVKEMPFNNPEYSTCHPTLSVDGSTLYFASNRPGGFGGMDLYKSVRSGSYWSVPENLGEKVNTAGNEIFPFINQEGTLFFASDGLAGIGGLDIYSTKWVNNDWLMAENMGKPINSAKDDFGYSQLENGQEGYFTSNRVGGFGGDDIYFWSSSVPPVINNQPNLITVIDEATNVKISDALVTIVEGVYKNKNNIPTATKVKNGVPQSNDYWARPITLLTDEKGGIQPEVRTGKTYTILVEKQGYAAVKKVVNATELLRQLEWIIPIKKRKGLALNGSVIQQAYNRTIPNAEVELFNLCTGEYETTVSDDEGNFAFFLECNCDYELTAKKERMVGEKRQYSTLNIDCRSTKPINSIVYMTVDKPKPASTISEPVPAVVESTTTLEVGQVITLEDVYYDFNKATIRGDASEALDRIVQLLVDYPSMEIELYSHTDARGDRDYNEKLSQRRANAAVKYITSRGINQRRLLGKGYGESSLKNDCKDGVKCDEWQHQENRRTEIKITKLDAEVRVEYRR